MRPERILLNDCVVRCRGLGEEVKHWQRVTALHKDYYFLPERFVIPSPSRINVFNAQNTPHTPKSTKVIASVASTPSAYSTSSSSATSSPAKSTDDASVRSKQPVTYRGAPAISDFLFYLHASFYRDSVTHPVSTAVTSQIIHFEYM